MNVKFDLVNDSLILSILVCEQWELFQKQLWIEELRNREWYVQSRSSLSTD